MSSAWDQHLEIMIVQIFWTISIKKKKKSFTVSTNHVIQDLEDLNTE